MRLLQLDDVRLGAFDALVVVDVQNDFLPGGSLAVQHGEEVIPILNRMMGRFAALGLPIFATRNWHPPNHISFRAQGGPWPPHCVQHTWGAQFANELELPSSAGIVSKATTPESDVYSGFEGTDLEPRLRGLGVRRLFIGGIATDYCVWSTVRDALSRGFPVLLLVDAVRAVNLQPFDGERAIAEMVRLGAVPTEAGGAWTPVRPSP